MTDVAISETFPSPYDGCSQAVHVLNNITFTLPLPFSNSEAMDLAGTTPSILIHLPTFSFTGSLHLFTFPSLGHVGAAKSYSNPSLTVIKPDCDYPTRLLALLSQFSAFRLVCKKCHR